MGTLAQDLRFARRQLRRHPAFTAAAVLSMSLAVGAGTAMHALVGAILFQPLPVTEPGELMALFTIEEGSPGLTPLSWPDYRDLRRQRQIFQQLAAYRTVAAHLAAGGEVEEISGQLVSSDFFRTLGVEASLGRSFVPAEGSAAGAAPVVVLSHDFWRRRFAADPELPGKTLQINGESFTVVGIAPPGFRGLNALDSDQFWAAMGAYRRLLPGAGDLLERRDRLAFRVVGRLADGVTRRQAAAALKSLAVGLRDDLAADSDLSFHLLPLAESTLDPQQRPLYLRAGVLLLAVVGLLLLLACVNVANLLVVRALVRREEIALRLTLGASQGRLLRQLLTEGGLLAALGAAAGLAAAVWMRNLLWGLRPPFFPRWLDVGLDARTLLSLLLLVGATTVLFGLLPAGQTRRLALRSDLVARGGVAAGGAGRGARLRSLLMVAQVAFSMVLLVGAGLLLSSLRNARRLDLGFDGTGLVLASFGVGGLGYDRTSGLDLYRRLVERVEGLPGVVSAALAVQPPLVEEGPRSSVVVEGQEGRRDLLRAGILFNRVGWGYFETLEMPLVQGRALTADDHRDSVAVAVVNQTMANWLWPGQHALGKRFQPGGEDAFLEVVGVAGDAKYSSLGEEPQPYFYRPLSQSFSPWATLHARTAEDPASVLEPLRKAVLEIEPNLAFADLRTLDQSVDEALWIPRLAAAVLTLFAIVGLALSVVGVYSFTAYAVSRRRRELGLRLALGAGRGQVFELVVRRTLALTAIGLALGVAGGYALARTAAGLLYAVRPAEPLAFAVTAAVLASAAVTASALAARRAVLGEPAAALQEG